MLFSLKAEKLYEFFMKATQLEEVLNWYHEAGDDLDIAKVYLLLEKKSFLSMQKEFEIIFISSKIYTTYLMFIYISF